MLKIGIAHLLLDIHKAANLDASSYRAWFNLGTTLVAVGKYDDAEASIRKAANLQPSSAEAWYNLGNLLGRQKRVSEAEESFRKAVEIKPRYGLVWAGQALS
ncbi:MAG: tetratricopeptide repeat protein [Candidatus Thorarchaeota archaeon]|nr:tetratricopeptide repeat protein [Candidatus Thorarchaeota archaeon]